jgi:predicted transcriptional regulator
MVAGTVTSRGGTSQRAGDDIEVRDQVRRQDSGIGDSGMTEGEHAHRRGAGELEAAVLSVLQAAATALTPAQVRERLGGELAYTTVVTILSRLYTKGVLTRMRSGRAYSYAPIADQPGLAARRMRGVLDAEADREAVLARFVSGLSAADEELLRSMLDDHPGDEPIGEPGGRSPR